MTTGDEREAALKQLEDALKTNDGDAKNFHIRDAIQLLHIEGRAGPATDDSVDKMAK